MEAYFIIGNNNIGKSSVVRALTGASQSSKPGKLWDIGYNKIITPTFVIISSPNEAKYTKEKLIEDLAKSSAKKLIIPLRHEVSGQEGSAEDYISTLIAANWNVAGAALQPGLVVPASLHQTKTAVVAMNWHGLSPANVTAAFCRMAWGID